jgi:hypothetical protein
LADVDFDPICLLNGWELIKLDFEGLNTSPDSQKNIETALALIVAASFMLFL